MPRSRRPAPWPFARGAEIALLTLAFFLPVAAGCVSNEYVIPKDELMHQAQMPTAARGQRVRVVQGLGDRRGYALPPTPPPPPIVEPPPLAIPQPTGEAESRGATEGDVDSDLDLRIDGGSGGGRAPRRSPAPRSRATPRTPTAWRGPGRAAPPAGGHGGGGGRFGGGGGGHFGGGGGGGGNGGDALVVLAVFVVVVGVLVGIGLVSGEGVRFDGYVRMAPEQPLHLKDGYGQMRELPLAALSPDDVLATVEAKVMDDEGFGIERLGRAPLDRTGGTFKLDSGESTFGLGTSSFYGPTANIQLGYFFTRRLGLLMNIALSGSTDGEGTVVTRHTFGLELQSLPLAGGRWHAGGYAEAGVALAGTTSNQVVSGPAGGGGALVELDLTSRLALTLRAGASLAHLDNGWSPAGSLALGIAVY